MFITGSLKIALVLVLGVLVGFAVGFFILAALWVFLAKDTENSAH
jgi:preprotein translocase subunit SecF